MALKEMVFCVMISLDDQQPNVQRFRDWCRKNRYSSCIVPGRRISSISEAKPWLTSYGYYVMHNWTEGCFHFDTTGPVGCFLAHRDAWSECVRRNETVWIFEEGVYAYDSPQFERLDRQNPTSDLILGHTIPMLRGWRQKPIALKTIDPGLTSIDKIYFGTKCYRISPGFSSMLLENSRRFDTHVDAFISVEAIRSADVFEVMRTTRNIVSAHSSGNINHSFDSTLITQCLLILLIGGVSLAVLYRYLRKVP